MGLRLHKVQEHTDRMVNLAENILQEAAAIKKIRTECPHCWKFGFQVNAHHNTIWHVFYQCLECGGEKHEKKEPVCQVCDTTLMRVDTVADTEAETERAKPEHNKDFANIALAFRCPACQKIHILRHQGD